MQAALTHEGAPLQQAEVEAHIQASPALAPAQRLAIYQRGYYARLLQCLEGQYKALCHALGKELFDDFARDYLKAHPSHSPTLSELGAHFPDFLENTRPDKDEVEKESWIDFMVDLARFEWQLYRVFDAPGHEGKPYADASVPDESLRLQPCFFLYQYRFPVDAYYHAVARGEDPDIPAAKARYLAICRKDYSIGIFSLLAPQYVFLTEVAKGSGIKTALKSTATAFDSPETAAQQAWATWKTNWCPAGFFMH